MFEIKVMVLVVSVDDGQGKRRKKISRRCQEPIVVANRALHIFPLLWELHHFEDAVLRFSDERIQIVVERGLIDLQVVLHRRFQSR